MKLLFDHNLSYKLVARLADVFPHSAHVRPLNLHEADDRTIWDYARDHDYTIVSKDEDLHQLSFLYGPPPKVVWVRLGNCTTAEIEQALRYHYPDLLRFYASEEGAFLIIGKRYP